MRLFAFGLAHVTVGAPPYMYGTVNPSPPRTDIQDQIYRCTPYQTAICIQPLTISGTRKHFHAVLTASLLVAYCVQNHHKCQALCMHVFAANYVVVSSGQPLCTQRHRWSAYIGIRTYLCTAVFSKAAAIDFLFHFLYYTFSIISTQ